MSTISEYDGYSLKDIPYVEVSEEEKEKLLSEAKEQARRALHDKLAAMKKTSDDSNKTE